MSAAIKDYSEARAEYLGTRQSKQPSSLASDSALDGAAQSRTLDKPP